MMCTIQAVSSLEGSLPTKDGFTKHKTYVVFLLTSHSLYLQVLAYISMGKGVVINSQNFNVTFLRTTERSTGQLAEL